MIIRPAQYSLRETVQRIEEDKHIAFGVKPTVILLRDQSGKRVESKIDQLSMLGPIREYANKTKGKGSYHGPIWRSGVNLFPSTGGIAEAADYLINEILGEPSAKRTRMLEDVLYESSLRYDFPARLQPKQDKRVPHVIDFVFSRGQEREWIEKNGHLEFGNVESLSWRLLYPPKPNNRWYDTPQIVHAVEKLAQVA